MIYLSTILHCTIRDIFPPLNFLLKYNETSCFPREFLSRK